MTKEELLRTRYRVIAHFPFCPPHMYDVGDVLTVGSLAIVDQKGNPVYVIRFEKYPHLFKRLEWWEERSLEEMPEYVIGKKQGDEYYLKIKKWENGGRYPVTLIDGFQYCAPYCNPITEQEYNEYVSKQKAK